ncbi:ATP-NAD kinase family protein [Histomonas meleagridis]|uniref:ATP-NAD kinase family protein n=1 Tax=Histomonas meleagridis TaxID=135588 RepID=UPI00355A8E68|nr:ATP-NAD kinase family protein [Histomonas meleagridis]KAH0797865.1 ATP-NAD kinase family protein [Histomonas meleagridis]
MKQNPKLEKEWEESSFIHRIIEIKNLDWEHEPSSVHLYVQDRLENLESDQIDSLIKYLESNGLRVEVGEYKSADFLILVGTDGLNLKISTLFQDKKTPPILPLTTRRQGFISDIQFSAYRDVIPQVIRGNCYVLPRCRLLIEYHSLKGVETYHVLNDLALYRDSLSGSLTIKCSSCGFCFSEIIGDGVIIATATGSTAYNKSAGGALVHPLLPVFMLTPVCAQSLSARPILFPRHAELTISLASKKAGHQTSQRAWVTFDGLGHRPFQIGEKLVVSISPYPYNTIMMEKSVGSWATKLAALMGWNERKHQKPLPKIEKK